MIFSPGRRDGPAARAGRIGSGFAETTAAPSVKAVGGSARLSPEAISACFDGDNSENSPARRAASLSGNGGGNVTTPARRALPTLPEYVPTGNSGKGGMDRSVAGTCART